MIVSLLHQNGAVLRSNMQIVWPQTNRTLISYANTRKNIIILPRICKETIQLRIIEQA